MCEVLKIVMKTLGTREARDLRQSLRKAEVPRRVTPRDKDMCTGQQDHWGSVDANTGCDCWT